MEALPSLDVFARSRRRGRRLVVLTAYDAPTARIAAQGGVDALLVGDSLGQVLLGHASTLPVTLAAMLHHASAVTRAQTGLPVIADLPYGAFHVDPRRTVEAGIRFVKQAGVQAVKIEGGQRRRQHLEALLDAEIPVMGHLGLTPQSLNKLGGYKVQGRDEREAEVLLEDAQFLADAGCFAVVLECIPSRLASRISASISIPTIGIGAGPGCDGQVLVFHDLLGLQTDFQPRFVKRYAQLGQVAVEAVSTFVQEVRAGVFPAQEHSYDAESQASEAERDAPSAGGDHHEGGR